MDQRHYAGVDLGGTLTKIAISDGDGKVIAERQMPTSSHNGPGIVLDRIATEVSRMAGEAGVKPSALGIGVPGIADIAAGVVRYLPNFPGHWENIAVREALESQVGCPVYIINDVKAATLGEMAFGLGKGVRTMILLALGTGIGGGIVVNGRLNLGRFGSAGEVGHIVVDGDGAPCGCGSRGCLETFVSGPALAAEGVRLVRSGQAPKLFDLVGGDIGKVDAKTMAQAANAGEESVRKAIRRAAVYLGIAVSNLIVAIDPELVVIGGGLARLGDLLMEPLRETVRETVHIYPTGDLRIEVSGVGEGAGVMGALALAIRGGLMDQLQA